MAISITTAQQKAVSELYVAFFNRAADSEGLGFWAGALASGKSIASVAQDMYLTAPARAYYSTALTNEQFIKAFYATVLNRATPDAEGVAFWTAALNQPSATQGSVAVQIMKAVRDYVDTPASPTNAAALTAKTLFAAKVDVSTAYALQGGTVAGASAVLNGVVDATTAAAAIANLGAGTIGSTFTLTTGTDNFVGTAGNDVFSGALVNSEAAAAATGSSVNASDLLAGGTGTDTLNLIVSGANSAAALVQVLPVMSGVEVVSVKNLSSGTAAGVTINAAAATGITAVANDSSTATVAFTGVASNAAINVTNSRAATAVTYNDTVFASGGTLAVNVSGAGSAAGAETITVGAAATAGTATAVTINATGANIVTLAQGANAIAGANGIKTLTVTGTGTLNLGAASQLTAATTLAADLTKLDASANTGGVTATVTNAKVVVTGGAGADVITVNGAEVAGASITLGAGNDKVLFGTGGSMSSAVVVDGGAGVDTIAAALITAGNGAIFKNFEKVDVAGLTAAGLDLALLTGSTISGLTMSAIGAASATVTGVATGSVLEVTGAIGGVNAIVDTFTVTGAVANTADVFGITFNGDAVATVPAAANQNAGTIAVANVETINIVSGGAANTWNAVTVTDNNATKITITGSQNLDLVVTAQTLIGAATTTKLALIDGSAATGKLNITDATAAANAEFIIGGSAADTITTGTVGGVTITGGAGNDNFVIVAPSASTTAQVFTTITDFAKGDVITFASATAFVTAKIDVSAATTLAAAITLATAGTATVDWFQYAGNTYVVNDVSAGTVNAADFVVKLTGLLDLSTSTIAANALTFA